MGMPLWVAGAGKKTKEKASGKENADQNANKSGSWTFTSGDEKISYQMGGGCCGCCPKQEVLEDRAVWALAL